MRITNEYVYNPNALGNGNDPEIIWASVVPDASSFFAMRKPGTLGIFQRAIGANYSMVEQYQKSGNSGIGSDWQCSAGILTYRLSVAEMIDGGAAAGTADITPQLPAGAYITGSTVKDVIGFAGDVSAALTIGTSGTPNQFCTGSYNVFATAPVPAGMTAQGTPSGNRSLSAATFVRLTVTTAADFTPCKTNGAGRATVSIFYQV